MNYCFEASFERDFKKNRNKKLAAQIIEAVTNVGNAKKWQDIPNIKKLTGYKTAYRIRCNDYRIGIFIENGTATFAAFDHRSKIYKHFP